MFGLIGGLIRLMTLALLVLGVRKAVEISHDGVESLTQRIEQGDSSPLAEACVRLHSALHKHGAGAEASGSEVPVSPYTEP